MADEQRTNGAVYFVQSPTGQIKIGTTKGSPEKRLSALQGSSPIPLVLRAAVPGGRELERRLHERFSDERLHGEWFNPSPDLLSLIESIHNGEPIEDDRTATVVDESVPERVPSVRSEVARARLTAAENELYQEGARKAGLSPSEYLRELILKEHGMPVRVNEIECRIEKLELVAEQLRTRHLESQVAQMLEEEL